MFKIHLLSHAMWAAGSRGAADLLHSWKFTMSPLGFAFQQGPHVKPLPLSPPATPGSEPFMLGINQLTSQKTLGIVAFTGWSKGSSRGLQVCLLRIQHDPVYQPLETPPRTKRGILRQCLTVMALPQWVPMVSTQFIHATVPELWQTHKRHLYPR